MSLDVAYIPAIHMDTNADLVIKCVADGVNVPYRRRYKVYLAH